MNNKWKYVRRHGLINVAVFLRQTGFTFLEKMIDAFDGNSLVVVATDEVIMKKWQIGQRVNLKVQSPV